MSGFRANPGWVAEASESLREALREVPSLGPPVVTVAGDEVTVLAGGPASLTAPVIGRDGAGANLDVLAGDAGATGGVWLAEQHAADLGVTAGDRLEVASGPSPLVIEVAGVHTDILATTSEQTAAFWRPVSGLLRPARPVVGGDPGQAASQRPALVTEPATALAITRGALGEAVVRWESTLASDALTLGEAHRLSDDIGRLRQALVAGDDPLGRAFGRIGPAPVLSSPVLAAVDRALDSLALAGAGIRTVQVAGGLLGIGVLAGLLSLRTRSNEVTIRREVALGVSPAGIAWSLVWPLLPVLGAGAGAGALLAGTVTGASAEGLQEAAMHCSVATVAAAAASWGAGLAAVVRTQRPGRTRRARAFAWDVPLLALAGAAAYQLVLRGSALVEGPDAQLRLDLLVLALPVLALGAAAGLLTRAIRRVLPRLRNSGARLPLAAFLAVRRIGHPHGSALVLLGFGMVTIGLSSYGGALAASAEAAEEAKARTRLGSDVVVELPRDARLATLPEGATLVGRATGRLASRAEQVYVMAVDPATFLQAAAWHEEFASTGGARLLSRLDGSTADGVPAVLVGAPDSGPERFLWRGTGVRLRPVGTARDLPGRSGRAPVVLVSAHRLGEALARRDPEVATDRLLDTELWLAGDEEALAGLLPGGLMAAFDVRTLADVRADPALQALGWTLGYLQAAGALAVLLALATAAGRTVALRREQATAVVIGGRLGMRAATHAWSAAIELAAVLTVAVAAGWLAGTGVAAIVVPFLDPLPSLPPRPTLRLAPGTLVAVAAACALTLCLGAAAARRHARRLSPAEHLRAGT